LRSADAAFTNLETLFHDYEGYAMHESHGAYMRSDPALARELAWMGFNLVSLANNHAGDYGVAGLQSTIHHVRAAGLTYAGTGESLDEAREASFLDTKSGRIALVAVTTTFPAHARASKRRGRVPARPGVNVLGHSTRVVVSREWLSRMEELLSEVVPLTVRGADQLLIPPGGVFAVGDPPGLVTEVNQRDINEIASVVDGASRLADYTIVSVHAHESGASRREPPRFLQLFARAMIDAGANVIAGHGPHVFRGIEIYQNKPIFYSLGAFIYQSETIPRLPEEAYDLLGLGALAQVADVNDLRQATTDFLCRPESWESVVALLRWREGKALEIELCPITLGFGGAYAVRGRPMLAQPGHGEKILCDVEALSRPFGTIIYRQDGSGVIRVDA
jgi:poly-gamma-glutamate synthesis protein (capsule biosynthesis protein)